MRRLEKFNTYNEGLKSMAHSFKRKLTGKSAGEEIETLSTKQKEKLEELYAQDPDNPMEAARYLRSIIIKEKNSQFGIGMALTIAGAAMIYKAMNVNPPPPPPPPPPKKEEIEVVVKAGDTYWDIAKRFYVGAKDKDLIDHTLKLCQHNGDKYFWSGAEGSPGLSPGWYDVEAALKGQMVKVADSIGAKIAQDCILRPGDIVKIPGLPK